MKLVVIFGAGAVGKMTVGQELMRRTGLRLYHNHMDIEPVIEIFGYRNSRAVTRIREVIFEEFAKGDSYGMIFTFMWALEDRSDWDYIGRLTAIFERVGAEICYAELVAPQAVRLERNATANRLDKKKSKRDVQASNARLMGEDANHRLESLEGEMPFENYIKIDNASLPPEEAARIIAERFGL